jgi:hypothetical protein
MKFPKRNIDISEYQSEVKALLGDTDCAIFIDTNIISQLYRLNDAARQDFYNWVKSCGDRFHIPVWVIHEYSNKIYHNKTTDYLSELSKIKQYSNDFSNISDFVKGYVGESLLVGSIYQGKVQDLKDEIDAIEDSLKKISTAISKNIAKHQNTVHEEIVKQLEGRILDTDIFSIVGIADNIFCQRSNNRIPPGYKDNAKEENRVGDYIIWMEILHYCRKNNVKKAILVTRDMKTDITYFPDNQTVEGYRSAGNTETIRVAKNSLVHEFYTYTQSEQFKIIDFRTFVKIFALQYKDLALSFQLAIAEEEKESAVAKTEAYSNDEVKIEQKHTRLLKDEGVANEVAPKQDTPYSGTAISDGQYFNEANIGCMDEIITQLKTYNWYVQNPAIDKIIKIQKLSVPNTIENRSSVFVLGRNIVQAAEGSSGNAIMFMENISIYIKEWADVFKQAMIDGMLFEVFFNFEGKIRPNEFKAHFFEDIMTNVQKLGLASPYKFINDRILKVDSRFVPLVGDDEEYTFVFALDNNGKTTNVQCNGRDISSTFKRSWRFQFADKEDINGALASYYGILKKNIQVVGIPEDVDVITYIEEPMELPF